MAGTARAASSVLTVTRTSSLPAACSARTCAAVAAASAVSVLVIDWTTIGWALPTSTPPTLTVTVGRRRLTARNLALKNLVLQRDADVKVLKAQPPGHVRPNIRGDPRPNTHPQRIRVEHRVSERYQRRRQQRYRVTGDQRPAIGRQVRRAREQGPLRSCEEDIEPHRAAAARADDRGRGGRRDRID